MRRSNLAWLAAAAVLAPLAPAVAADLPRAAPADVGMDAAALAELKAKMTAVVDRGERAGIVYLVVRRGKVVAHEAIGLRDVERNLPMEPDTQFRIYSMSRQITAASTLTLVEQGRLGLQDPVSRYIPEVAKTQVVKTVRDGQVVETEPQATPMTVRHLFTYTAGLGYAFNWPKGVGFQQDAVVPLDGTIEQGMKALAGYPLLDQPGARWRYGFSGDMLGRVTEVAAGQPLNSFLQTVMFDKVDMKDTGFWTTEPDRLAKVYGNTAEDPKLALQKPYPLSYFDRPGPFFSAGGGLVSTAMDYARFAQMLLNGGEIDGQRVLKPETVKAMLSRQTTPEQGLVFADRPDIAKDMNAGYAWGLSIGVRVDDVPHTIPGSPGDVLWGGLADTTFFIDPKQELVAVGMAQYTGPNGDAMRRTLREGVYKALATK